MIIDESNNRFEDIKTIWELDMLGIRPNKNVKNKSENNVWQLSLLG